MDAKNYIHLTDNKYDLIISDAINPSQIAENASLYSKDYFIKAAERLNEGGIMGCWLPIEEIPVSSINSIIGTFKEVFPYLTIWVPLTKWGGYNFFYIIGSKQPQTYSPKYIDEVLQQNEDVRNSVDYINFNDSHYVLSCYICDEKGIDKYLNGYKINSDNRPFIEFNTDITEKIPQKNSWIQTFIALTRSDNLLSKIDWTGMSDIEKENWSIRQKQFYDAGKYLIKLRFSNNPLELLTYCNDGLKIMPDHVFLVKFRKKMFNEIISNDKLNPQIIINYADNVLKVNPGNSDFYVIKSWALLKQNNEKQAFATLEKAMEVSKNDGFSFYGVGSLHLGKNELEKSVRYLEYAIRLEPENSAYYMNLGSAYVLLKQYDSALKQFQKMVELAPNSVEPYFYIAEVYKFQKKY